MPERTIFVEGLGWTRGEEPTPQTVEPKVDLDQPETGRVKVDRWGQHVLNQEKPRSKP